MANNKLAIIGGSGLYDVEELKNRELIDLDTPWGKPSDQILKTNYNSKEVYFLPRHGKGHFISPSNINFRANIDALKQLGVTDIVSISAVGSLKEDLHPGKFVIIDQFIDRTFARNKTFFDDEIVAHVSMAHPTSKGLMNACEYAIKKDGIDYQINASMKYGKLEYDESKLQNAYYKEKGDQLDVKGKTLRANDQSPLIKLNGYECNVYL